MTHKYLLAYTKRPGIPKAAFLFLFFISNAYQLFSQAPVIFGFSPNYAASGTEISISGNNFHPTPSNNVVYFGPLKAQVLSASANLLKVKLPSAVCNERISVASLESHLIAYSRELYNSSFSPNSNTFRFTPASLGARIDFPALADQNDVVIADIDGDGKPDVLTTSFAVDSFSVYRNISDSNGTVSLASPINFPTGSYIPSFATGDFNADGKLDVALCMGTGVSTYRNTSTPGSISFAPRVYFSTNIADPQKIVVADFDGNGMADIGVACQNPHGFFVLENLSDLLTFYFERTSVFNTGNVYGTNIVVADFGIDNKPDIATQSTDKIALLRNTSTPGNFSFTTKNITIPFSGSGMAVFDKYGNGVNNLAVTDYTNHKVALYKTNFNLGPDSINFDAPEMYTTGAGPETVTVADIKGDGTPDIITANANVKNISFILNDSFATYLPKVDYSSALNHNSIVAADLNMDGAPEIITTNSRVGFTNTISVIVNQQVMAAPAIQSFFPTSVAANGQVTIHGKNFAEVTSVTFGGAPAASFTIISDSVIIAAVGSGASGFVEVRSDSAYGKLGGFQFEYQQNHSNIINILAGNGFEGYGGDGNAALLSSFRRPASMCVDTARDFLYFNDESNYRIRRVNLNNGIITTVAGSGVQGFEGDGAAAINAKINSFGGGITVDKYGNILFVDRGNARVRKIDIATGFISTVAGNGSLSNEVDGIPATTAGLSLPSGIAVDQDDNVYVTSLVTVKKIDASSGLISTIAGMSQYTGSLPDFDTVPAFSARFSKLWAMAIDANKNLYVADNVYLLNGKLICKIRKIDNDNGLVTTVAGNGTFGGDGEGGLAVNAQIGTCSSLAVDSSGTKLYFTHTGDGASVKRSVFMIDLATGILSSVAGKNYIPAYSGDGGDALQADMMAPFAVAASVQGKIYVSDAARIRTIGPALPKADVCGGSSTSFTSDILGSSYTWQVSLDSGVTYTNVGSADPNITGVSTATLVLASMPSNWYGRKLRCRVNGQYSQVFTIAIKNYWTGAVDAAWENPANWSCNALPDANTDVFINSGTVQINSNAICRTFVTVPGVTVSIGTGFNLTVTH